MKNLFLLSIILCSSQFLQAQQVITLDEAIARVSNEHPMVKSSLEEQQQQQALKRASFDLPKTNISYMKGQYNSIAKNDNNITISQSIPFPTTFTSQRNLATASIRASEIKTDVVKNDLVFQVRTLYMDIMYRQSLNALYVKNDSLYGTLVNAVDVRYRTGEGTLLEKTAVETQFMEIQNQRTQNAAAIQSLQAQLAMLLQLQEAVTVTGVFEKLPESGSWNFDANPSLQYWRQQSQVAFRQRKVEVSRFLPEITVGYFNQTLIGFQTLNGQEQYFGPSKRFQGYIVGLAVPLWFTSHTARIRAASYNQRAYEYQQQAFQNDIQRQAEDLMQNLNRTKNNLAYYEQKALQNAGLLEKQSLLSFRGGDIDYATFLLNLRQSLSIRERYLQALHEYNQYIISLEHLTGTR